MQATILMNYKNTDFSFIEILISLFIYYKLKEISKKIYIETLISYKKFQKKNIQRKIKKKNIEYRHIEKIL
jgi:hypothetical protein